jgi:predicted outer membrane repeat protein
MRPFRIEHLENRRVMAVLTVNSLLDNETAADGLVTLREALVAANDDSTTDLGQTGAGADRIEFAGSLFSGGSQTLNLTNGALVIRSDVEISGPGRDLLILDGQSASRIVAIDDGDDLTHSAVTLREMTLRGGRADGAADPGDGGAVYSAESLTIDHLTVVESSAAGSGGGVFANLPLGANLVVANSTLSGNQAQADGGGLALRAVAGTDAHLRDLQLSSNAAFGRGGGGSLKAYDYGQVSLLRVVITDNTATHGGGLDVQSSAGGTLTLSDSRLTGNTASGSSTGSAGYVALGGGMALDLTGDAMLTLTGSTISGNLGGGLAADLVDNSTFITTASVINDNRPVGSLNYGGGGMHLLVQQGSVAVVQNSTVSGNLARGPVNVPGAIGGSGGGIYAYAVENSRFDLFDSTVSLNQSTGDGGGIYASAYDASGITLSNSTISGNEAQASGGGIYLPEGLNVEIKHSTITGNVADSLNAGTGGGGGMYVYGDPATMSHSVIAQNVDRSNQAPEVYGPLSVAYSLIGDDSGATLTLVGSGNLVGEAGAPVDPRLGPLLYHGGRVATHALLTGSPAIDAGNPTAVAGASGVPLHDARGFPFARVAAGGVSGTRIDLGAFELQSVAASADFDTDQKISGMDFLAWQRGFGLVIGAATTDGDADYDSDVDTADLALWEAGFGAPAITAAAHATHQELSEESSTQPSAEYLAGIVSHWTQTDQPLRDEQKARRQAFATWPQ